jgi:hypothetical protein
MRKMMFLQNMNKMMLLQMMQYQQSLMQFVRPEQTMMYQHLPHLLQIKRKMKIVRKMHLTPSLMMSGHSLHNLLN